MRGGAAAGGQGIELDPLIGWDDPRKPLRSKLLAVPELRDRHLANLRTLASESLAPEHFAPLVARYRDLIAEEVKQDSRKLASYEAFLTATATEAGGPVDQGSRPRLSLLQIATQRSQYLLQDQADPAPQSQAEGAQQ